jgi:hypothetical protein
MALIQFSSLVSAISGSIGGITFSKNRAGSVAKQRVTGHVAMKSKQSFALSLSALITSFWSQLPAGYKTEWNTYAATYPYTDRFGRVKTLTGMQYFKMIASNGYYTYGSFYTTPSVYITPPALPSFTVTLTTSDIIITFSTPIDLATTRLILFSSAPTKSIATTNRGSYSISSLAGVSYASSFSVKTQWEKAHGLNWVSIANLGHFNINIMLIPIQYTTLVSGLAVASNGSI